MNSIREVIISEVRAIVQQQPDKAPSLSDELTLAESGLDSLNFAILLARLDGRLGFDPFDGAEDFQYPVTLGDLVGFYEKHAK